MSVLDQLESLAADLPKEHVADDDLADVIGRVNKIATSLQGYKRTLMSELPGPVAGSLYRIVEGNTAVRSYNSAGLIHAFETQGWNLRDLMRVDAVRLSWRWTELQRAFRDAHVTVTVAQHELEDLGEIDGPLIGEVWERKLAVEGVKS